jgi:N-acetylglucosaminyl-diphospho-decaprenol L-rhamnosyltransferase
MSATHTPDLTIVTVTFKSKGVINRCLDSLAADGYLPDGPNSKVEVIIVDSCSDDGTAEEVAAAYPTVTVVPLEENVGFARGCNVGIRRSTSSRVLLLNPDCVVHPGTIDGLLAELESHPKAAVVGPRLTCQSGEPQVSTQNFPSVTQEFARHLAPIAGKLGVEDMGTDQPEKSCPVDWISGACMMMRRDAIEDFGLLDESFFLYYEETDWCKRALEAGWEVRHLPTVSIVHVGGQSVAVSGKETLSGLSLGFYIDSRRIYFRKHYGVHAMLAIEAIHASRKLVRSAKSMVGMPVGAW